MANKNIELYEINSNFNGKGRGRVIIFREGLWGRVKILQSFCWGGSLYFYPPFKISTPPPPLLISDNSLKPIELNLDPVVQSPISTNPGLTLNKTFRVNPELALI